MYEKMFVTTISHKRFFDFYGFLGNTKLHIKSFKQFLKKSSQKLSPIGVGAVDRCIIYRFDGAKTVGSISVFIDFCLHLKFSIV